MRIMPSLCLGTHFLRVLFTCLVPGLFTWAMPGVLAAQTFADIGERAQGMGAFVAVADDSSAIYWNPAGLAWPTGSTFDAQLDVASAPDGIALPGRTGLTFLGAAMPALGIAFYRTRVPASASSGLPTVSASSDRNTEGLEAVRPRALSTANVAITVNQTVVNGLVIGSTVRVVTGGVPDRSSRTTVDLDAGAMVTAGNVRAGLTVRNLRKPEFEGDSGQIALERQVRAGIAFAPRSLPTGAHGPFTLAFDADLTRVPTGGIDRREAAFGGEFWVLRGFVGARAGVRWSTLEDSRSAVSAGLTLKLPSSLYVEGHLADAKDSDDLAWGLGLRMTF